MSIETCHRLHARLYDRTRWSLLFGRSLTIDRVVTGARPLERVLEVGCGAGSNLALLGDRLPAAALVGVDVSEDKLAVARRKVDDAVTELYRGRHPDDAPEGSFDLVLFSDALTMFDPRWEQVLRAATDALAPGATLAVVDFHDTRTSVFRDWMRLNHVRVESPLLPRLHGAFPDGEARVRPAFLGSGSTSRSRPIETPEAWGPFPNHCPHALTVEGPI